MRAVSRQWVFLVLATAMTTAGCDFVGVPGSETESADAGGSEDTDAGDRTPLDMDFDDDGILDDEDNCVQTPNPLQADEDGDTVGDLCDNCPADANADQANVGEINASDVADELGDVCDPRPDRGGDRIGYFNGFNAPLEANWSFADGSQNWQVQNGQLVRTDTNGVGTIYWTGAEMTNSVVETRATINTMPGGGDPMAGVGVIAHYEENPQEGYACIEAHNSQTSSNTLATYTFTPPQIFQIGGSSSTTPSLANNMVVDFRFAAVGDANRIECERSSNGISASRGQNVFNHTSGYVGLHTYRTAVGYHHLVVYALGGSDI